ncbi:MAG: ROK family protein [Varibaculum sp.]|nr:ROK family protein [Varibaculum sp.]
MVETAIAIDLGGTKTAAALVTDTGVLTGRETKADTPALAGGQAILDTIAQLVTEKKVELGQVPSAIGIGAAGAIDATRGVVVSSSGTIHDWVGTDIVGGLRERLDWAAEVPIKVINDADAHAVGESWVGAAAGASSMLMVAVGTGIGCAFCVDGRVLQGAHHMAGEIGNARIPFTEAPFVTDGNLPAKLEENTAGSAMTGFYRAAVNGGIDDGAARGMHIMELAAAGDQDAAHVVSLLGKRLGAVISWYVLMLDPAVIVLGGGVVQPGGPWWQAFEEQLTRLLPPYLRDKVDLRQAQLRGSAAFFGAARAAFDLAGVAT